MEQISPSAPLYACHLEQQYFSLLLKGQTASSSSSARSEGIFWSVWSSLLLETPAAFFGQMAPFSLLVLFFLTHLLPDK